MSRAKSSPLMVDGTSAPDRALRIVRAPLAFGTIVVVGGGCYGGYYVRQLGRACAAGALTWQRLVVVDKDAECAVSRLPDADRPGGLSVVVADWMDYFDRYLSTAAVDVESHRTDAIVPSPLMPHLMAQWIVARAQRRWPGRGLRVSPLESEPSVPWQRAGEDGTHYVSFAEWMCPINCIEPARCPATKGARSWSMPVALEAYAKREREAGRPVVGPFVFHCSHRAFGVGMIDVCDVLAADDTIARRAAAGAASVLVGTASHCHGALQRIVLDA